MLSFIAMQHSTECVALSARQRTPADGAAHSPRERGAACPPCDSGGACLHNGDCHESCVNPSIDALELPGVDLLDSQDVLSTQASEDSRYHVDAESAGTSGDEYPSDEEQSFHGDLVSDATVNPFLAALAELQDARRKACLGSEGEPADYSFMTGETRSPKGSGVACPPLVSEAACPSHQGDNNRKRPRDEPIPQERAVTPPFKLHKALERTDDLCTPSEKIPRGSSSTDSCPLGDMCPHFGCPHHLIVFMDPSEEYTLGGRIPPCTHGM